MKRTLSAVVVLIVTFGMVLWPVQAQVAVRPSAVNSAGFSSVALTAPSFSATAASGANGLSLLEGAHLHLGSNYLYYDGMAIKTSGSIEVQGVVYPGSTGVLVLSGWISDGATANAIIVRNVITLATAGATIMCWAPDNAGTKVACVGKDGMFQFGIGNVATPPTCVAGLRGKLWYTGGGTGVTDTVSMCLKSVADTYSWVTITTGG